MEPSSDARSETAARALLSELGASEAELRERLEPLLESIRRAHAVNPASWSLTLSRQRHYVTVNVGRILTVRLRAEGTSLSLMDEELPPDLRRELAARAAELQPYSFRAVEGITCYEFPAGELPALWPRLREAHLAAADRAARAVARTPYYTSHSPALARLVGEITGQDVPWPEYGQATVSPERAEGLVNLMRSRYPDWDGFAHPEFTAEEITYKQEALAKIRELLARETLDRLLAAGEHGEVIQRLEKAGHETNLLFLTVPLQGDLNILYQENLDRPAFCRVVRDLLYGEGDSPQRLERYLAYVRGAGLPSKWTFPTYFLFVCHPESEIFIKPEVTTAVLRFLGREESIRGEPTAERYAFLRDLAVEISGALGAYEPRDMVDIQSLIWVCGSALRKQVVDPRRRREMRQLFQEFLGSYPADPGFERHRRLYAEARAAAAESFREITAAHAAGEDVTDRVLTRLLPHADTEGNRARGAWIHIASAVTKDVKTWFEGAGWTQADAWPQVALEILGFFRTCLEDPAHLGSACRRLSKSLPSKGFQAGMLSPLLNALAPESFVIVNSRSRRLINYLAKKKLTQSLSDYPEANEICQRILEELEPILTAPDWSSELAPCDLFDMFAHWLVAVRKFPFPDEKHWKIAPGGGPEDWEACRDGGYIAMGWSELGDVSGLSRAAFNRRRDHLVAERDDWSKTAADQVWRFAHIAEGDRILANRGTGEVLGLGTVTGPYYFVPDEPYGHRLPVEWTKTSPLEVDQPGWNLTLLTLNRETFERIEEAGATQRATEDETAPSSRVAAEGKGTGGPSDEKRPQPPYPLEQLAADTGFAEDVLERWTRAVERKGQAIFYGPPGTGKTFIAEHMARHIVGGGKGFTELVQFHPSYAYEDFIQGIRPALTDGGALTYKLVEGRFRDFCRRAQLLGCEDHCVLIIDEINRANLSRVFGELMYLLEYRGREVPLAGGESLRIPESVRILGTMNTADRSIALVDHALRRRFAFLELRPDYGVLRRYHENGSTGFPVEPLIAILEQVNGEIGDRHYQLGISFFLREELLDEIEDVWRMEVEPYLEEHFFDQPERVERLRWEEVGRKILP